MKSAHIIRKNKMKLKTLMKSEILHFRLKLKNKQTEAKLLISANLIIVVMTVKEWLFPKNHTRKHAA